MGYKIQFCDDFSSVDFIYLIPFALRLVWINKLHDLMKGFFPHNCCHGNRKKTFFQLSWQQLLRGKMVNQENESYRYILPLRKLI